MNVILTIMVLDLKPPTEITLTAVQHNLQARDVYMNEFVRIDP
jgi:hypothetical protein